jgi:hypothetical protein
MATQTITSDPILTPVGTSGSKLQTKTVTTYEVDGNGKIIPGTAKTEILYNNSTIPLVQNFVPAAASTDGGKTWDTTSQRYLDINGKPNFGADAVKSLNQGALKTNTQNQIKTSAEKQGKLPESEVAKLADSAKNQSTPEAPGVSEDTAVGVDPKNAEKGLGENLKYPLDMNTRQDCIVFTMKESNPRALGEGAAGPFSIGQRTNTDKRLGSVRLPISGAIVDANTVGWGQDDLDPFQMAAAKIFRDGALKGLNTVGENLQRSSDQISNNSESVKQAAVSFLNAEAIGKPVNNLLSRTTGAIINPNVELLFNGVSLRPFNFSFKMSARTQKEALIIKQIIYFFKKGMAAKQTKSGFFLKKPYVFDIEYLHNGQKHPGMNLIKQCALQNFGVNYVPDAQYAAHEDGNMTSYEITMQFTELDPLYFDDYDGNHPIGY